MGKVKERKATSEQERDLKETQHDCITVLESFIRSAAMTYDVQYGTLRDRLQGVKPLTKAHNQEQVVEKGAIVRFCVTLDDLGHPPRESLVKAL